MIEFDYGSVRNLSHLVGRALTTFQGIQHTYILASHALAVPGVFVECGVAYGGSAAAMIHAAVDHQQERDFHLFDSFQGIPYAGPRDDIQPGFAGVVLSRDLPLKERLRSSGISSSSIAEVTRHFKEWKLPMDRVFFHEGWFQDVLPKTEIGDIAMLRLDGDLYESTLCCLEWLYPKVVKGGVVLIDDWPLAGCQRAVRDYFKDSLPDFSAKVDYGAVHWIKNI